MQNYKHFFYSTVNGKRQLNLTDVVYNNTTESIQKVEVNIGDKFAMYTENESDTFIAEIISFDDSDEIKDNEMSDNFCYVYVKDITNTKVYVPLINLVCKKPNMDKSQLDSRNAKMKEFQKQQQASDNKSYAMVTTKPDVDELKIINIEESKSVKPITEAVKKALIKRIQRELNLLDESDKEVLNASLDLIIEDCQRIKS